MVFIHLILEIIIRVGQNFPRTTSWSSGRCIALPLKLHEVAKRKLDLHVDHQMICVPALFFQLIRHIFPDLVDVVLLYLRPLLDFVVVKIGKFLANLLGLHQLSPQITLFMIMVHLNFFRIVTILVQVQIILVSSDES